VENRKTRGGKGGRGETEKKVGQKGEMVKTGHQGGSMGGNCLGFIQGERSVYIAGLRTKKRRRRVVFGEE